MYGCIQMVNECCIKTNKIATKKLSVLTNKWKTKPNCSWAFTEKWVSKLKLFLFYSLPKMISEFGVTLNHSMFGTTMVLRDSWSRKWTENFFERDNLIKTFLDWLLECRCWFQVKLAAQCIFLENWIVENSAMEQLNRPDQLAPPQRNITIYFMYLQYTKTLKLRKNSLCPTFALFSGSWNTQN